jgi:transcriptional regulator with XRE-family HTH domain
LTIPAGAPKVVAHPKDAAAGARDRPAACRARSAAFPTAGCTGTRPADGRTHAIASQHFNLDPQDHADTIGGRIARAREAAGFTVAQAARRLGVKTATWQGWENDRAEPRSNKLTMMAGALAVSPTWLLGGYGDGPTEAVEDEVQVLRQELKSVAQDVAAAQARLDAVLERLETFQTYHHVEPA